MCFYNQVFIASIIKGQLVIKSMDFKINWMFKLKQPTKATAVISDLLNNIIIAVMSFIIIHFKLIILRPIKCLTIDCSIIKLNFNLRFNNGSIYTNQHYQELFIPNSTIKDWFSYLISINIKQNKILQLLLLDLFHF